MDDLDKMSEEEINFIYGYDKPDCPDIFFREMLTSDVRFCVYKCRLTCTDTSIMYGAMMEEVNKGNAVVDRIEPHHPSFNQDTPTFSYDVSLTEDGIIFMEFLML